METGMPSLPNCVCAELARNIGRSFTDASQNAQVFRLYATYAARSAPDGEPDWDIMKGFAAT